MRFRNPEHKGFSPSKREALVNTAWHTLAGFSNLIGMLWDEDLVDPFDNPPDFVDDVEGQMHNVHKHLKSLETSFIKLIEMMGLEDTHATEEASS